jgi:hypothetical protein
MTPDEVAEGMHSFICSCGEKNCPRVAADLRSYGEQVINDLALGIREDELTAKIRAEARAEALEEAAKVVDVKAQERRDVYATGLAEWCSLCEVREAIRCLKHATPPARLGASGRGSEMLTHEQAAEKCAELLASYANHDHGYWSSPPEVPRCPGVNSIDECDFTMNLRRQFKRAVKAWEMTAPSHEVGR